MCVLGSGMNREQILPLLYMTAFQIFEKCYPITPHVTFSVEGKKICQGFPILFSSSSPSPASEETTVQPWKEICRSGQILIKNEWRSRPSQIPLEQEGKISCRTWKGEGWGEREVKGEPDPLPRDGRPGALRTLPFGWRVVHLCSFH